MKYKLCPQGNFNNDIYFKVTTNTTDEEVEILLGLPIQHLHGFNITPQKKTNDVWKTTFNSKDDFDKHLKHYKESWPNKICDKLDSFLDEIDKEIAKTKIEKSHLEEISFQPLPALPVNILNAFPVRLGKFSTPYICPKCRTDCENWLAPYHTLGLGPLGEFDDVSALLNLSNCSKCHKKPNSIFDYQSEYKDYIRKVFENNFFGAFYDFLETETVTATCEFHENRINTINLKDLGVSDSALILSVNLTPNGKITPIEMHGNDVFFKQDYNNKNISYWPAEIFGGVGKRVSISVKWIDEHIQAQHNNFLEMMKGFVHRDQNLFIMGGNRSVEENLLQLCMLALTPSRDEFVGKPKEHEKETRNFLISSATYSHQLKFLLRLICQSYNIPAISREILKDIDRVRGYRNEIAHRGKLNFVLEESDFLHLASSITAVYSLLHLMKSTVASDRTN
ncbi:hypothetical protein A9266_12915 [Vibrio tasmaniensis]|nr:hypothetical protein A9266_12915 [Vibrio tasmaniensis]